MKKRFFILASIFVSLCVYSQEQMPQLPYDSNVKFGKLDNGLTYYTRKNSYVPGRAEFYIVQNVGSILEKPEQRGLAHFLEHMAFNGTKHFPDKALINYLETIGVKFGANLNAYTSVDETVYYFSDVPVTRPQTVDSCLLILRDWSDGITLADSEIEKERGVIEEEWRTRDNAIMRMYDKILPEIYAGTKYADCMPIGDIKVIRGFKPEALRSYYREWYRPDLQGIIVVGDIDPDYVLSKLQETFKDCKVPENASERIWYQVTDNKEPIIVTSRDKENTSAGVLIDFKHNVFPKEKTNSVEYLINDFANTLIETMLNARFDEILQKPGAPFSFLYASDGKFLLSNTKEAFEYYSGCTDQNVRATLVKILEENERVTRYGFTASEFERAKADILTAVEKRYNERDKTKNRAYSTEYINNFTKGEPFPGIEFEYVIYKQLAGMLPLEQLNEMARHPIDSGNVVIWMRGTEKEKVEFPTDEEVLSIMDSIKKADIPPYVDNVITEPLTSDITAGSIVSEKLMPDSSYHIVLSNGVEVDVRPTTLKQDEILMTAVANGGISSIYKKGDNVSTMQLLDDMAAVGGLGKFSTTDLRKALAGKKANAGMEFGEYVTSMSGNSVVKDLETLMQLIYLNFTDIRQDDDAYKSLLAQYDAYLRNAEVSPNVELADSIASVIYGNNPFKRRFKTENLYEASYPDGLQIIKKLTGNAANFKFAFTGNIDMDSIRPLLCKYVASLPSGKKKSKIKDLGTAPAKGERKVAYRKVMENPKTSVIIISDGKFNYTLENIVNMKALDHILDIVYFEKVREEDGGTYGVHSQFTKDALPYQRFTLTMQFDTDSAKYEKLVPILFAELKNIADNGPRPEDVQKSKEYFLKVYADAQVTNNYWLGIKTEEYITGLNMDNGYVDAVNAISVESIKALANTLLKSMQTKQVVQVGKK